MAVVLVWGIESKMGDYARFEEIMGQIGARPVSKSAGAAVDGFSFKGTPITYHKGYPTTEEVAVAISGNHAYRLKDDLQKGDNIAAKVLEGSEGRDAALRLMFGH